MKRGILFSLLSLALAAFLILIFWTVTATRLDLTSSIGAARASQLEEQLRDWEVYVTDATKAATQEAGAAVTFHYRNKDTLLNEFGGPPLDEATLFLTRCLLNGTGLEPGSTVCKVNNGMGGGVRPLPQRLDEYTRLVNTTVHANITYNITSAVSISDYAPFELRVVYTMNYSLSDPTSAVWNRTRVFDVIVSMRGLPEPLWARFNGVIDNAYDDRLLIEYPTPRPVMLKENVTDMMSRQMYAAQPGIAPSYLERIAGITTPPFSEIAGYETLINETVLKSNFFNSGHLGKEFNVSYSEHQIFAVERTNTYYSCGRDVIGINNFPHDPWRLDPERLARYNFNHSQDYNLSCPP